MRTTLRIDDALLARTKEFAAQSNRTITSVVEDALREALSRRKTVPTAQRIRLPSMGGKGLRPGVVLDDSASLLDWMEEGHETP